MEYLVNLKLDVLCDGQFGSTGKGVLAAYLGKHKNYTFHATNAGAQSGHTSIINGKKHIAFHLSTAGIFQRLDPTTKRSGVQFLSAGCIIDPEVLVAEINKYGYTSDDLFIHPHAAIITPRDVLEDGCCGPEKIASTGKGVGAALSHKIMRNGITAKDHEILKHYTNNYQLSARGNTLSRLCSDNATALLEIPQGYSLGINSGFYPHTTSRECSVAQGLADMGVSPRNLRRVYMSMRSFPIRVGNTKNGDSGGWYPDQRELSWEEVGATPEMTTVTGRVRRIGTFSQTQYANALITNRPDVVFMNFMNYMNNKQSAILHNQMVAVEQTLGLCPEHLWGYGPNSTDISTARKT